MTKMWIRLVARSGNTAMKAAAAAFRFDAVMASVPADQSPVSIAMRPELARRHWRHRERLRWISQRPMESRY
jgi:hypothetical protein